MAYFGDTLAHSALIGVTLGFLLSVNLTKDVRNAIHGLEVWPY